MKLRITRHAVQRCHERVKPAITERVAWQELDLLLRSAEIVDHPPCWKPLSPDESPFYAELSDGIAVAIAANGTVVTVITRSSLPPEMRRNRNAKNRRHRGGKHKKDLRGHGNGRPKSRIEEEAWPT